MGFSVEIQLQGQVVMATVVGELDEVNYLSMRGQVRASLVQAGAQGVLLDLRRAVVQASLPGIFNVAASNVEAIPDECKYAIVYSEHTLPEADAQFGETVARNRGAQLRAFSDLAAAQAWLGESGVAPEQLS